MTKARYADKRDGNEREIIDWLESHGCRVIQMPRATGYDLEVKIPGGGSMIVEVKNPDRYWRMEDSEKEMLEWCKANNHAYYVIQTVYELAAIMEVTA